MTGDFDANLPPKLLDRAFPFHFAVDERGRIVHAGPRFREIAGELDGIGSFFALDAIDSPIPIRDIDSLRRSEGDLQVVRIPVLGGILLRGEFMSDVENGIVRFLGHPWITDLSQLADQGLGLGDFPVNAGVADLLVLLQARNNAVADMRRLNDRLKETSDELAGRNFELERELENRKRLQHQLLQSQKMEAIGQLASGVAHDFNNVLLAVSGHATLGANARRLDDAIRHFESIIEAGDRAADITARLLVFARRRRLEIVDIDLAEAVRESVLLLDPLLEERYELRIDMEPGYTVIRADSMAIQQVIVNLVVNARDAMAGGGVIVIRTRRHREGSVVTLSGGERPAGDWVVIEVEDEGIGIDDSVLPRIFEPFFTTKDLGEGTGLGLATAWWIVERSGGVVDVKTMPGHGTTIAIHLPVTTIRSSSTGKFAGDDGEIGGRGRMLFVEDDELVRRAMVGLLAADGWDVEAVESGDRAISLLEGADWSYDVVVTDLAIPGVDGREIARRVHERRPEMPVVLMSGCDPQHDLEGRIATLLKPFTIAELNTAIHGIA